MFSYLDKGTEQERILLQAWVFSQERNDKAREGKRGSRQKSRRLCRIQVGDGGGLDQGSGLRDGTKKVDLSFIHFLLLL